MRNIATILPQRQYATSLKVASILEILAGIWLIIAPFVLNFSDTSAALWNSIIIGVVVAFLAGTRATEEGNKVTWPSWVNLILAVWLILTPFMFAFTDVGMAYGNTLIFGIVVAVLAVWSLITTPKMMGE